MRQAKFFKSRAVIYSPRRRFDPVAIAMRKKKIGALVSILSWAALALAQRQTAPWKEYVFADDGFAITVPDVPYPHPDTQLPEMTVYTVSLQSDVKLSLRVSHQNRDCDATLAELKDGALKGKSGIDPSSVKDLFVDGHPGVEYQYGLGDRSSLDRFYCVNGRFYSFSSSWSHNQPRPAAVARAVSSFRLLKAESHK